MISRSATALSPASSQGWRWQCRMTRGTTPPCEDGWPRRHPPHGRMASPFLESGGRRSAEGTQRRRRSVEAWKVLSDGIQALLDDPQIASSEFNHEYAGRHTIEGAIAMFFLNDVLIHTWDLARATGGDETLDAGEVHRMFSGIEPYDEMLRSSGQYGPRVAVPDDADEQSKLIAFMGRQP